MTEEIKLAGGTVGVGGWFKFEAIKPDGTRRILADWFPNLITNGGMDRIGTGNSGNGDLYVRCSVGTGSTTPAFTDTGLVSFLVSTTSFAPGGSVDGTSASSPYYAWSRRTYRFVPGQATGNLSEVGIGWAASNVNGSLFSRALILDGGGLPTTITVLSDETLDVTYEFRVYAPTVDVTGNVTIAGVVYAFVVRPGNVAAWGTYGINGSILTTGSGAQAHAGVLAAANASVPCTSAGFSSGIASPAPTIVTAYVPGSYYIDLRQNWALADMNTGGGGGIGCIDLRNGINAQNVSVMGRWQIQFTPKVPKDGTKIMTLTVRYSWARH